MRAYDAVRFGVALLLGAVAAWFSGVRLRGGGTPPERDSRLLVSSAWSGALAMALPAPRRQ